MAGISESRVKEIILEVWQTPENASMVQSIVESRFNNIEARLVAVEEQATAYLRQIEAEVKKTQGQMQQSVDDVMKHVAFLDEKRTEIVDHNRQVQEKLIEFEKASGEENQKIAEAVNQINGKAEEIEQAQRNFAENMAKSGQDTAGKLESQKQETVAAVNAAGEVLWRRIEEAKAESRQMAEATAAAVREGGGMKGESYKGRTLGNTKYSP